MATAGFFVLRTPLLPFDTAVGLSDGLTAARTGGPPEQLEESLRRDRTLVRARLRALVETPAIRDAIFVASPDLDQAVETWLQAPDSERGEAVERSLMRYVIRMAARATPFGLFAGVGVGTVGPATRLTVCRQQECRRHTRLDMDYLVQLGETLAKEPTLASTIQFAPNTSLYRLADRWRYVETRFHDNTRSHHLVALDDHEALTATLGRGRDGATRQELADALADDDITWEEANAFVGELIDAQILVPDLQCPITGPEPLGHLERAIRRSPAAATLADRLAAVAAELSAIDAAGIGIPPARYRRVATELEALPSKVELKRLFQVDLVKPSAGAMLGRDVIDEITRGVEILRRLSPAVDHDDGLERFRAAFADRYGERTVPLVEALDEESGVGAALVGAGHDASLLLRDLEFPELQPRTTAWDRREKGLLARVGAALLADRHEIRLTAKDIEELANREARPLPDAFSAMATLIAGTDASPAASGFRVLLHYAGGPSAARLLGRFCHADPDLQRYVEGHLREEEACDPGAVYAEIVHLPDGRLGNILLRPVLREYEIPYLGRSGAEASRQLPASDLQVSLVDGRFVVRSSRLGRRVVPRLTSAHNFAYRSLSVYRFLCLLQSEGRAGALSWHWGPLAALPFLPRVTCGRLVLSCATWQVNGDEIRRLNSFHGARRFAAVQEWRAERRFPRWLVLADYDNTLPFDLDNVVAVDTLVPLLKGHESATLTEMYPGQEELCAAGADGRYVHELLVAFHGKQDTGSRHDVPVAVASASQRAFAPGSEWVYAKLYAGTGAADRLLLETIGPVSRQLLRRGAIDRWFFIRYADPDEHLRWRLRVVPGTRPASVQRRIEREAASLIAAGVVRRLEFDTYDREVERYGGPEGVDVAERWFWADSEAVLDVLAVVGGSDAAADLRWQAAIPGVDALLDDLGLGLDAKRVLLQKLRDGFGREFRADATFGRQLGKKFRSARADLERWLESNAADGSSAGWRRAFRERSGRSQAAIDDLKACAARGSLSRSIPRLAESYVHMHLNRLIRAQPRAHELVIYDFLLCLYEGRVARGRAGAT